MEIADIKKLHSKNVDFCASTRGGEIGDAEQKLRLLEAALQQNVDKGELDTRDAGGDEGGDQGPRREEDAARGEREASGGQTIAKETARRIATKKSIWTIDVRRAPIGLVLGATQMDNATTSAHVWSTRQSHTLLTHSGVKRHMRTRR
jgi:hypothetical protein